MTQASREYMVVSLQNGGFRLVVDDEEGPLLFDEDGHRLNPPSPDAFRWSPEEEPVSDQFWDTVGRNLPLETQMAVRPHPVLDAVYIEVSFGERRIEHLFAVPTEDDLPLAPAVGQRLTALLNASA